MARQVAPGPPFTSLDEAAVGRTYVVASATTLYEVIGAGPTRKATDRFIASFGAPGFAALTLAVVAGTGGVDAQVTGFAHVSPSAGSSGPITVNLNSTDAARLAASFLALPFRRVAMCHDNELLYRIMFRFAVECRARSQGRRLRLRRRG